VDDIKSRRDTIVEVN